MVLICWVNEAEDVLLCDFLLVLSDFGCCWLALQQSKFSGLGTHTATFEQVCQLQLQPSKVDTNQGDAQELLGDGVRNLKSLTLDIELDGFLSRIIGEKSED